MSELTSNIGSTEKLGKSPSWSSPTENEGHDRLEQHSNGETFRAHENEQNEPNGENTGHLITPEDKLSGLQNSSLVTNQNGEKINMNSREHIAEEHRNGLGGIDFIERGQDLSSAEKPEDAYAGLPENATISNDNVQADQMLSGNISQKVLEVKNINDESENSKMESREPVATSFAGSDENLPIVAGSLLEQSGETSRDTDNSASTTRNSEITSPVSKDAGIASQNTDGLENIRSDSQDALTNPLNTTEDELHSAENESKENAISVDRTHSDSQNAPIPNADLDGEHILDKQALGETRTSSESANGVEDIHSNETSSVSADTAGGEQQRLLTESTDVSNLRSSPETEIGDENHVSGDSRESIVENVPEDPIAPIVAAGNGSGETAVTEQSVPDANGNERLSSEDNNENRPNQGHYVERNFGQEEEANMSGNTQNQEPEEPLLQGGRVPLRDISETMEHQDGRQQDEYGDHDQDTDGQTGGNGRNRVEDDGGCFSQRPMMPMSTRFIPIAPRQRRPEDDIPGPSGYNPRRGRRPEDDIPGPSNPQPRKIASWLLQNANVNRHQGMRRRNPQDDIPGPSHSSPVYTERREEDDMPNTSDSYQDEPIVGEELAQLLKIANVSRFQAGLPPADKTPPYEYVYGGSPSPTNDGPSTSGASTSGPSTTYIDADFEYAKRLQEEENRRVRFEEDNQQSSSSSRPYDPWVPSRYQYDGNDGDNEGEGDREIKIAPHINHEDAFLHKECVRLYAICRNRLPDIYVPEPMSIPNMHPFEFISGYKDVISGGVFPFPETAEPPVPPGSPGPSEEAYRSTTVTTAYQVVQGPNGEKSLKKKLTLKIPRNIAFPVAKRQLKKDGGLSRKQALQAESFPSGDPSSRPTAFQKFVRANDAALSRVPTKPLFSDDHYDEPGVPGPGPSSREYRKHQEYIFRKRRLEAFVDIESGEPEISSRRIDTASEEDEGMADDMNEADDQPIRKDGDGVFAVPANPLRVGEVPSLESSKGEHSFYETSPAGQRRIYEQRRKRVEKPRLSLQIPLNDHEEGTSSSGGRRSRSPTRRSGGSSVFSQDLMNRHAFLRRTDDADSIFNTGTMSDLRVDCGDEPVATNTVSTQAAESNWPNIPWKDPEDMPSIDEIPEAELRKMPAEYVDAIIECQVGENAGQRWNGQGTDEKKKLLEASYMQICRSYIQTPCRVPREVLNTRFEIYIRFPFFQRPLYVQNVLVALQIPDNEGNVLARVPEKYLAMSLAEFFKEGVKVLFGLRLTDTPTTKAISNEQLDDACVKYLQEVSSRWYSEVPLLPYDKQVDRENEIHDQMESLEATAVSDSDLAEMERYRLQFLEEQKLSAQRQRMKVVGNSLSRFIPRNPAINRVRLADVVEVDDSVNTGLVRHPEVRRDREREEGELDSDDDELTETQL